MVFWNPFSHALILFLFFETPSHMSSRLTFNLRFSYISFLNIGILCCCHHGQIPNSWILIFSYFFYCVHTAGLYNNNIMTNHIYFVLYILNIVMKYRSNFLFYVLDLVFSYKIIWHIVLLAMLLKWFFFGLAVLYHIAIHLTWLLILLCCEC